MGLMHIMMDLLFGAGRNRVKETAEIFRVNAEAQAIREADRAAASLDQFAAEFGRADRSRYDSFIDGLNRLPRPALALGTIGLVGSAMVDPVWFASRMQGLALVPEPLWWLLGAIVSFYFGARHQLKAQDFQRSLAVAATRGSRDRPGYETTGPATEFGRGSNKALDDWRDSRAD